MSEFKVYPPAPGWNSSSGVPPPPPPTTSDDVSKSIVSKKSGEEKREKSGEEFDIDGIQEKTLRTIFTLLDSDQDKLLDIDQLRTAIIAMGIPPAPRLIQDIVRNVPPRFKNRGVDFDTFKAVITDRLRSNPVKMSDIEELFKSFESGHDGVVTDVSLRHIMEVETTNKTNLSDEEVDEIFEELGIRRKDPINYRDFMNKISSGFVNFA
jgi:Ca2+-binding EF-hand superfamily protein